MKHEIGIIGGGEHMGLAAIKDAHPNIVIVDIDGVKRHRDTFDVNGVEYTPIVREQKINRKLHRLETLASVLMPSIPYINPYAGEQVRHNRQLPEDTNIIKEYGLVQQKKSKLSRWERDAVVSVFERNFKKVTE